MDHANRIALSGGLKMVKMKGETFQFLTWQRAGNSNLPIHIYIEGDGFAWASRSRPSMNPTPKNPVALRLAAKDTAENVIYLGRPCQYIPIHRAGPCTQSYWTDKRFAPEIITDYMHLLDDLKRQTNVAEFWITGFSGGGNIAAILAAQRDDISKLRTVAGNLDHDTLHSLHNVSLTPASLNARNYARSLSTLPQIHFIGRDDKIIPPAIFKNYKSAMGPSDCNKAVMVKGVNHTQGWDLLWPELLKEKFTC